jgi:hypothetical protein
MSVQTVRMTGALSRSSAVRSRAQVLPAVTAPLVWGGALVLMASGAGAVVSADAVMGGRIVGFGVVTLGLALFLWAALSLSAGRMLSPRASVAACLAGIAASGLLLALDPVHASVVAVGATALLLGVGAVLTIASRRRADVGGAASVWALIAAAAVVAVVVTPALGSVQDGVLSSPDGTRIVVPAHEGH